MLGEKIAEQRKKLGLSQEELAEKLNISQKSISKYELGDRKPQYKVLARMAEYFGVTTDYLLELDGGGNTVLGERIAELRKVCDMSQKELGEKLGVSASAIGMYEQGRREPSNAMLIAMEKLFGVTVDYLLGVTDSAENEPESSVTRKFGNRLRELRVSEGITQLQMAVILDTSKSNISKYEAGTVEPGMDTINTIARFFKVTTDYLFGLETGGNTMIGGKIAELRKELELSQEEMAKKIGISRSALSLYEIDRREPDLETVKKIASLFGVTTDYLLGLVKGGNTMLGKRINELRRASGMTQEELGKKLGVVKSTISLWESDSSEPNHAATIALAKLFGVTTDYLLGVEGDTMGTEEKTNEITQRVGRNIRSIREQDGLSQDEFAEGFGVKQPTVANWEIGKRQPDLNMLIQIAQFGGTSLDDLVTKDLTPPVPLYVRNMVYLRKKRGYSQGELATVLGLQGANSIDLVESGKCELPVSKLVHLAEFFGVTLDQIIRQDLSQEVSGCRQQ